MIANFVDIKTPPFSLSLCNTQTSIDLTNLIQHAWSIPSTEQKHKPNLKSVYQSTSEYYHVSLYLLRLFLRKAQFPVGARDVQETQGGQELYCKHAATCQGCARRRLSEMYQEQEGGSSKLTFGGWCCSYMNGRIGVNQARMTNFVLLRNGIFTEVCSDLLGFSDGRSWLCCES